MSKQGLWPLIVAAAITVLSAVLMGAAGDTRTQHVQKVQLEDAAGDVLGVNPDGSINTARVDPCQSAGIAKSSAVISATAGAELVAISGSTVIYVCGFSVNVVAGTTPGFRFIHGTGAVCATGLTGLTGIYLLPLNGDTSYTPGGTAFKTPAGKALCIDVSGVGVDFRGVLTYVQQ